ncbi:MULTISPECIES: hypothetical protein [Caballeronia]|uniref:hypothetical protein n=1 Tax=Caballeronia TaxID=1827195 RepID=UPI00158D4A4E|nr:MULTISPECIES: hypothetical protein [Caballeronia]MCG7403406.1 hypothetical protein [Caballeronia zhejiangensis]MCI1045762.1 hypothetical protein [Caballeronia zhejiangensis]MDR5766524.1 hypothetical protein [Caballeronia sp. LZ028]
MTKLNNDEAYLLITEFIEAINAQDAQTLQAKFDVTMPILEEIKETLAEYFLDNPRIGVAPLDRAFIEQRGSRRFIDVFEMNGGEAWGVEAVLWSDGKPQEPILQVEIQRDHAQMRLRYKYIGS